jgi:peptidoglycan/LPS O-acetylase OafA/YrhL
MLLTEKYFMQLIKKFRYRPEIDGLRAVAVVSVILYHAGLGFSGGFVGVDVFFVISGFLITSLIWKDLEQGNFTFPRFWEKRARRIVPAAVVVIIATLIAGWYLLLPGDFKKLGAAAMAQSFFSANFHFWHDSGYFEGIAAQKPLLQTWSLAVEEQFYLFAPLILWCMYRAKVLRGRLAVILMLGLGFMLSFALSIYNVAHHPTAAFYLLPTRAWELLLGGILAFVPVSSLLLGRRYFREIIAIIGLAFILIPVFLYNSGTPFPGLAALFPCLGTALVIWANSLSSTVVGGMLSKRPVVFVGLISYSLYLWHWPLLAFSKYLAFTPLSFGYRVALIMLGFVCAILSWKYVETPFRIKKVGTSRKSTFVFAGSGLIIAFVCGLLVMKRKGFPQRFPAQALKFADAAEDTAFHNELTTQDILAGKLVPIGVKDQKLHPSVFVWGDSHAMAALPAVDSWLKEKGLAGRAATHSQTPPVLDRSKFAGATYRLQTQDAYNKAVLEYLKKERIPNVILIATWSGYMGDSVISAQAFNAGLLGTIRRLVAIGSCPWVLLDVPQPHFNVPRALALSFVSGKDITKYCAKPVLPNELELKDNGITPEIKAGGGHILDPKPYFLDKTGRYYILQVNGVALYHDQEHLTASGAKLMILPLLQNSFHIERMK